MRHSRDQRLHYLISSTALIISRCLLMFGGFAAVAILASRFGASTETDAYFIARMVPVTLVAPLATAFNLAFVPVYSRALVRQGEESAGRLAIDFLNVVGVLAFGLTLLYMAGAPWLIKALAPGFSTSTSELTVWMTRLMALAALMMAVHAVFDSVLNAHRRFVISALSSLWIPAGALFGVLVLADFWGIRGLAVGVVAGFVLHTLTLVPIVPRYLRGYRPSVDLRSPVLRRSLWDLTLAIVVVSVWQINTVVDRMIASLAGEGAVSALSLGHVFVGLVPALIAFPVYKVMYPDLIRLIGEDRGDELRRFFASNFLLIGFLTIPIAAALVVLSREITDLAFHHDRFSETAARQTTQVILWLAPGLPTSIGAILIVYYFLITRRVKLIITVLAATVTANALLDWVLMKLMGVGGIALSSTLISVVRTAIFVVIAGRLLGGSIVRSLPVPMVKVVVSSIVAGGSIYAMMRLFGTIVTMKGPVVQLLVLLTALMLGGLVYLAANILLRNTGAWRLLAPSRQSRPDRCAD